MKTYSSDSTGISRLTGWLRRSRCPLRMAFEATGGHEWPVWEALDAAGLYARQVSPAEVKGLGKMFALPAKTDWIDARAIAIFLRLRPDAGRKLPRKNRRELRELAEIRQQSVAARV